MSPDERWDDEGEDDEIDGDETDDDALERDDHAATPPLMHEGMPMPRGAPPARGAARQIDRALYEERRER